MSARKEKGEREQRGKLPGPVEEIAREARERSAFVRPAMPRPDSGYAPRTKVHNGINKSVYLSKRGARVVRELCGKFQRSESGILSRLAEKYGEMVLKDSRMTL